MGCVSSTRCTQEGTRVTEQFQKSDLTFTIVQNYGNPLLETPTGQTVRNDAKLGTYLVCLQWRLANRKRLAWSSNWCLSLPNEFCARKYALSTNDDDKVGTRGDGLVAMVQDDLELQDKFYLHGNDIKMEVRTCTAGLIFPVTLLGPQAADFMIDEVRDFRMHPKRTWRAGVGEM